MYMRHVRITEGLCMASRHPDNLERKLGKHGSDKTAQVYLYLWIANTIDIQYLGNPAASSIPEKKMGKATVDRKAHCVIVPVSPEGVGALEAGECNIESQR
jgi:hypothetical protein